jgi:exodeoxyribonuclease X
VIETGWCDLDAATGAIGAGGGYLCGVGPDVPMPPDARSVHHLRRSDLVGFPPHDARCFYEDAVRAGAVCLAAHSADFEAKHIMGSLPLVCTYKASLRVWPDAPAHKNMALLYMLEDAGVEFDQERAWPPHRAESDAYASAVILREIMATGVTGPQLFEWTRSPALLPRCPIGTWRGHPWADIDDGFLHWILRTITDREDLRYCAGLELNRRHQGDQR